MNADGQGLLRAILEHPEEMVHRFVYADFLEDDGQEVRANYIRGMGAWPDRTDLPALIEWPDSLTKLLGYTWPDSPRDAGWDWKWRRGFIEEISCPTNELLQHAETLFRHHPIMRVTLTDKVPSYIKSEGTGKYTWCEAIASWITVAHCVPQPLWVALIGRPAPFMAIPRLEYDTREEALSALSAGAVKLGRQRARLAVEALGVASEGAGGG